jgi:hypothetical protein
MSKFPKFVGVGTIALISSIAVLLFSIRHSSPVVICTSLDDSIRPRDHCLLNPFRDRRAEQVSEAILSRLKNGDSDSIKPFLQHRTDDEQMHLIANESKYRILSWRIGGISRISSELSVQYWVKRTAYDDNAEEEVNFFFIEESDSLKLKSMSTIY